MLSTSPWGCVVRDSFLTLARPKDHFRAFRRQQGRDDGSTIATQRPPRVDDARLDHDAADAVPDARGDERRWRRWFHPRLRRAQVADLKALPVGAFRANAALVYPDYEYAPL